MRYILRRLAFYLVTLWLAITLNFAVPRLMPGDPAAIMFSRFQGRATPAQFIALKAALGFTDQNIIGQYFTYLWNVFHLNFGISYAHYPVPVMDVIRNELPWTLFLLGTATVISFASAPFSGSFLPGEEGLFLTARCRRLPCSCRRSPTSGSPCF